MSYQLTKLMNLKVAVVVLVVKWQRLGAGGEVNEHETRSFVVFIEFVFFVIFLGFHENVFGRKTTFGYAMKSLHHSDLRWVERRSVTFYGCATSR